jgi:hypothetical protein
VGTEDEITTDSLLLSILSSRVRFLLRERDADKRIKHVQVIWTDKNSRAQFAPHLPYQCEPGYWLTARADGVAGLLNVLLEVDEDTSQPELDRIISDALQVLEATARIAGRTESGKDQYSGYMEAKVDLQSDAPMTMKWIKGLR